MRTRLPDEPKAVSFDAGLCVRERIPICDSRIGPAGLPDDRIRVPDETDVRLRPEPHLFRRNTPILLRSSSPVRRVRRKACCGNIDRRFRRISLPSASAGRVCSPGPLTDRA